MFKFSSWSLIKKSLIGINLISFVLIATASGIAFKHLGSQGERGLSRKISSLSDFVKRASAKAFWDLDNDTLKALPKQLAEDADVAAVVFNDKAGKVIESIAKEKDFEQYPFHEVKVTPPVGGDEVIGSIKIYYTTKWIDQDAKRFLVGFIFGAVVFQILLSLTIFLFLGRASRRLEKSMDKLRQASEDSRSSGLTLKELSAKLSNKVISQNQSIEETSATLNELSAILSKSVESSTEAFDVAVETFDFAQKGQSENSALDTAMKQISEGAAKIQEITTVVDDIAFQTNILALNAAVEAARAGEHGKGFAVVADAVRSLAQKSTAAAKDINNLIIESTGRVEKGKELVKSNLEIFEGILHSAQKVKQINEVILQSSREQSNGINQITQAMLQIDQAVNESAVSTEHTASHAEKMVAQSESLNGVVYDFAKEIKGSDAA